MTKTTATTLLVLVAALSLSMGCGRGASQSPAPKPLAKSWELVEWAHAEPMQLDALRGRVVVVRFWTDTCPYCERSLPALQSLADEFAARPVTIIGAYHSKPRGSERPWRDAVAKAESWGVKFPLAYDRGWKTVDSWWLRDNERAATSSTFVIDRAGRIAHIHPGPVFFPSDDPADSRSDQDFRALREAITRALAERDPR